MDGVTGRSRTECLSAGISTGLNSNSSTNAIAAVLTTSTDLNDDERTGTRLSSGLPTGAVPRLDDALSISCHSLGLEGGSMLRIGLPKEGITDGEFCRMLIVKIEMSSRFGFGLE